MLDAQLSPKRIGRALEKRGHNVLALSAHQEFEGISDAQVLEFATEERRIVATCDAQDFAPIARSWAEAGRDYAGLILIWTLPTSAFAPLASGIHGTLQRHPPKEWRGLAEVL